MTIRTLAKVPLRSQPATFPEDTENLLSNLPGWTAEVNATAESVAELHAQTNNAAVSLAENTPIVVASSNFKGLWSGLSGPLNVPASVYHGGAYWVLATNLANVATATPGVAAAWLPFPNGNNLYNIHNGVI